MGKKRIGQSGSNLFEMLARAGTMNDAIAVYRRTCCDSLVSGLCEEKAHLQGACISKPAPHRPKSTKTLGGY